MAGFLSFPSSAWERTSAKLRFAGTIEEVQNGDGALQGVGDVGGL